MRFVIALVLLLVAAPMARAESSLPDKEPKPAIARTAVEVKEPTQPELKVAKVKTEAPAAASAATQEMPRRGSFLWLVGVIVVAGVILAVLL